MSLLFRYFAAGFTGDALIMNTAILTITGSDGTGGSGVQADIRFINGLGGMAASVITSITVQNTLGIQEFYDLPATVVRRQVEAIVNDLQPQVVKVGLLRSIGVVEAVVEVLKKYRPRHIIYAPVLKSTKGEQLVSEKVYETIERLLLPMCTVVLEPSSLSVAPCKHGHANQLSSAVAFYLCRGEQVDEAMRHARSYLKQLPAVTTPEQARIAEEAGACAVMALERIPADIRAAGGVSRMSDPKMIRGIQEAVSIPVMAKCRIGHIAEAQILQAIEIDYIDESEVLSPADNIYHIDKTKFDVPFVCGAKNLGEALRRIAEGATMIRTKGEPGTGDVVQAVSHMRLMQSEIRRLAAMSEDELFEAAKQLQAPYELVKFVHENGKLPVVNFAAGGVATPADAALMMQLEAEGVFVGSGIFKSGNPRKRAAAIVGAVTNYQDAKLLAELSEDLGEAMVGINEQEIQLLMAERGK